MSNTGFLWFPFLYLQFWRTFIRGLLTAIMSGEWNSVVGMDHMSPAHSQESDLRNNLPNLDISKTLFWRYFWKMCFVSKSSCLQHRVLKVISGKKFPSLNISNFFPITLIKYQKPNFFSHLNFYQLKIARHENICNYTRWWYVMNLDWYYFVAFQWRYPIKPCL